MANRKVIVSVSADTRKFRKAFKNLKKDSGLESLARLGAAATKAMGIGAAATAAFAGKAIKMAGDMQQSAGAIDDVFKKSATSMHRFAAKAAESVGISANAYNELATLIGSQLKNAGVPIDQLATKTDTLIKVGADLSAMFGGSAKEAVEAISSALKGERDPIEKYGVSLKQASIDAEAAALGFHKVGGSFDQQAQAAATLSLIMKQTADAHGKFGREADTFQHKLQVGKAHLEDFAAAMGSALLPAATALIGALDTSLTPAAKNLADYTQKNLTPAVEQFSGYVKTNVVPTISILATEFKNNVWPAVKTIGQILITDLIPAIISTIGFIVEWRNVIIPLAGVLIAPVAGLYALHRAVTTARSAMVAFKAGQKLVNTVLQTSKNDIAAAKNAFTSLKNVAATSVSQLRAAATALATMGKNAIAGAAGLARTAAAWALQKAQMIASMTVMAAQRAATLASAAAQWALNAALTANPIGIVVVAIAALVGGLIYLYNHNETVRKGVKAAWAVISGSIRTAASYISSAFSAISSGARRLYSWFTSLPSRILGAVSGAGRWLYNIGRDVINGFINGLSSIWHRLTSKISSLANLLPSTVKKVLGIASPSRVFTRIGEYTGEGLAIGLTSMSGKVQAAAKQMAAAAIVEPPPLNLNGYQLTATSPRTLPGSPTQIVINVQCLNPTIEAGRTIAKALKEYQTLGGR